MAFLLVMVGAALACGLQLLEALAIVLAVALTRRTRDALLGALAAAFICALLAGLLGPLLLDQPLRPRRPMPAHVQELDPSLMAASGVIFKSISGQPPRRGDSARRSPLTGSSDDGHSDAVPSPSRSSPKWSFPTTVIGPATYFGPSPLPPSQA
jgi:hypothetical protein